MSTEDVAREVAALLAAGKDDEVGERFWSADVRSLEAPGPIPSAEGLEATRAKAEQFVAEHDVHSAQIRGPYVHGDQFSLHLAYDMTRKATGERFGFEEIALYTVRDGKIVEERFFYPPQP
jgi:ketosteroid isomerase-like protein